MQTLKAATLIAATVVFAFTATAPAFAGGQKTEGQETASSMRWATIAAEGQRFQEQRNAVAPTHAAKQKNFLAMAMTARNAR